MHGPSWQRVLFIKNLVANHKRAGWRTLNMCAWRLLEYIRELISTLTGEQIRHQV